MTQGPGRTGIGYEEVASAAEALLAKGGRATSRAVRDSLGTGSLGTVQRHLNVWKASRQRTATQDLEISTELRKALLTEIEKCIATAGAQTLQELADAAKDRDDLAGELELRVGEIEGLSAQVAELESAVATKNGTIDELRAAATLRAEREQQALSRVEGLTRDLARADVRLDELPKLERSIADLRSQQEAAREQRHAAERKISMLETRAVQHIEVQKEREALTIKLSDMQQALSESEASRREELARAESLLNALTLSEDRLAKAETRFAESEANVRKIMEQFLTR